MCRNPALAATALMLTFAFAGSPALAWGAKTPAAPPTQAQGPTPAPSSAVDGKQKASAQDRLAAERWDPLTRAAFWASQVNIDAKDAEAGTKLAMALRQIGRYQEAWDAAQEVLRHHPNDVEALLESARVAVSDNQGFFAIDPAKRAMTLAPKDWRAPSLLAVGYDQAEQPQAALKAHQTAMALAPGNPLVLSNAAMFYAAQGDKSSAEAMLRKAAAMPTAGLQVRQNLALVLGLEGKMAEAEQLERQVLPPAMVANNLAYLQATQPKVVETK
jgi:Flp pilus assembly protein TadD